MLTGRHTIIGFLASIVPAAKSILVKQHMLERDYVCSMHKVKNTVPAPLGGSGRMTPAPLVYPLLPARSSWDAIRQSRNRDELRLRCFEPVDFEELFRQDPGMILGCDNNRSVANSVGRLTRVTNERSGRAV